MRVTDVWPALPDVGVIVTVQLRVALPAPQFAGFNVRSDTGSKLPFTLANVFVNGGEPVRLKLSCVL